MSVRGKDFRGELSADSHEKLRLLSEFSGKDLSPLGIELLEKMIAAEWHAYTLVLARMERSGIVRQQSRPGGGS
jgi:hypothetical protein